MFTEERDRHGEPRDAHDVVSGFRPRGNRKFRDVADVPSGLFDVAVMGPDPGGRLFTLLLQQLR